MSSGSRNRRELHLDAYYSHPTIIEFVKLGLMTSREDMDSEELKVIFRLLTFINWQSPSIEKERERERVKKAKKRAKELKKRAKQQRKREKESDREPLLAEDHCSQAPQRMNRRDRKAVYEPLLKHKFY
ncbi:hypothetical protein D9756_008799 [Leucocoprinus leucothites]|uniref:Uncharacterized protein n=1 Tax=Leucocoprinus leucothites TaxID=201217 RepID=A0A8H5CXD4_9AGAR|nr:hypothetical protein D9756_008799 [Leucoagaricus leucothites]